MRGRRIIPLWYDYLTAMLGVLGILCKVLVAVTCVLGRLAEMKKNIIK